MTDHPDPGPDDAGIPPAHLPELGRVRLVHALLDDAGLPPGFLSVVIGGGGSVGNAIVDHPDVPMISFTGSPPVGWGIRQRQPRKEVALELGISMERYLQDQVDSSWVTVSLETVGMWQQVGFLARAFDIFARHARTREGRLQLSVQFEYASAAISPQSRELLSRLSAAMRAPAFASHSRCS